MFFFYCAVWNWRVTLIFFWPGSYFLIFLSLIRTFLILLYKQRVRLLLLGNRLQCIPRHVHSDNFMQMPSFLFNHKTAAFTLVTTAGLHCRNSRLVIAFLLTPLPEFSHPSRWVEGSWLLLEVKRWTQKVLVSFLLIWLEFILFYTMMKVLKWSLAALARAIWQLFLRKQIKSQSSTDWSMSAGIPSKVLLDT